MPRTPITKVEDNGLLEHEYFGAVIPFASKTGDIVLAFHHRRVKVNTLGSLDSALRDRAAPFPKQLLEAAR